MSKKAKSRNGNGADLVPVHEREYVRDCEPGDRFRVGCWKCSRRGGKQHVRTYVASNWLNGGPMGREIVDGVEQELEPIDGGLRMELVT